MIVIIDELTNSRSMRHLVLTLLHKGRSLVTVLHGIREVAG